MSKSTTPKKVQKLTRRQRAEFDVTGNREVLLTLKKAGYWFEISQFGYAIWFENTYIGGAGVMGKPRMHWQHAKKNKAMFLFHAVNMAEDDYNKRGMSQ